MGNIQVNFYEFCPVVQEEMLVKENFTDDGRTTDAGQRVITISHLEPSGQVT